MKLKLNVTRHTTASELIILGAFFESLALAREGRISSVSADEPLTAPTDPAELQEPETVVVQAAPAAGEEAPKRRRRSKEEIDAANQRHVQKGIAEAEAKAGPFYWSHPESSSFGIVQTREELDKALAGDPCCEEVTKEQYDKLVAEADAGNVQPAPTQPARETPSGAAETPATASPSEPPTHASLNLKATAVAKKIGPEKIKAKINELGGKLISTLSPEALIEFDQWLDAQ